MLPHAIDEAVDAELAILDNGSSHISKETKAWFTTHTRWVVHYTPGTPAGSPRSSCSLDPLQRKVIANGNVSSRDDLVAKLLAFSINDDETAKPFAWPYSGAPLKVAG